MIVGLSSFKLEAASITIYVIPILGEHKKKTSTAKSDKKKFRTKIKYLTAKSTPVYQF